MMDAKERKGENNDGRTTDRKRGIYSKYRGEERRQRESGTNEKGRLYIQSVWCMRLMENVGGLDSEDRRER